MTGFRSPDGKPGARALPPVPTGIQRLLRLAADDPAFRAKLLEHRDDAARAAGIELTPTERVVLRAASIAQLEAMADNLPPVAPRRDFIWKTAAAAAALIGAPALLQSCVAVVRPDEPPTGGATSDAAAPDPPPPRPERNEMPGYGGMAPDEPPPREQPEVEPPDEPPPPNPTPAGVRPDLPPERQR